ncbi:molybdopterin-dependent oxidoreductase [Streptomyces chryseus]|uniref:Oxidoreductase molybdopterin-binding domain-containing protein n=1 Tax=Streptomyces chryseus TaxID=68186 RepID=A0ABQ3DJ29_9ACTN|nr:molybdopterin-dependent oxidoreductase [Streptomyces chryseus]GHA96964.1 hypothetical protein GCM10010346_19670 [Streptomyces chryseus]
MRAWTDTGAHPPAHGWRTSARNHGLPLEALRHDVTPPGPHYVLVHYGIPVTASEDWRLTAGGRVRKPLTLGLRTLRSFPAVTLRGTMKCAG